VNRIRLMLSGAWPTLLVMAAIFIVASLFGADWPNAWYRHSVLPPVPSQQSWTDFTIFVLGVMFLTIKSTIMIQRSGRPVDRLTLALVGCNYAFSLVYLYAILRPAFGEAVARHRDVDTIMGIALRVAVPWTVAWGIWVLINTPPGTGYVLKRGEDE
jgi:hypothetical protein